MRMWEVYILAFGNELDDRQLKAIELLATGKTVSNTATLVGVNRKTIATWKQQEKFKAELDSRVAEFKKIGRTKIIQQVPKCIDNVIELANNCTDSRVKFNANKYIIDQGLGSPSAINKEEINTADGEEGTDQNTLKNEIDEIKNIRVVK